MTDQVLRKLVHQNWYLYGVNWTHSEPILWAYNHSTRLYARGEGVTFEAALGALVKDCEAGGVPLVAYDYDFRLPPGVA